MLTAGWEELTHVVLNIADIEGGGRDCQAQALFLGDKNGLREAMLLHVAQCELAAWHTGHDIFRTVGKCKSEVTSNKVLASLHPDRPGLGLRAGDIRPALMPPISHSPK